MSFIHSPQMCTLDAMLALTRPLHCTLRSSSACERQGQVFNPMRATPFVSVAWLYMLVDWAFLQWKGLTTSITTQISTHHCEMLFWVVFHAIPGACCVSFPWGRGRATASSLFVFAFVDVNFTFSRNWSSCRTTKSCPSGYGNLNRVNICIILIFLVRHFSL